MPPNQRNSIHVVDPDEALGKALTALLGVYGIDVRHYSNAEAYVTAQASFEAPPGCVLVDADLPGLDGIDLLGQLRKQGKKVPIIVIGDANSDSARHRAKQLGALEVLEKPLITTVLLGRLSQLFPDEPFELEGKSDGLRLRNGSRVTIRTMQPQDAEIEQAFVRGLSTRSRFLRFFSGIRELSPGLLENLTNPDFPRSYALIATVCADNREKQVAVARFAHTEEKGVAEFAVVVDDAWQGIGLATRLLRAIISAAAIAGVRRLEGLVLKENAAMLRLAENFGFGLSGYEGDASIVRIHKDLACIG